ncbi:MAG: cache domain-containing protein, partial [Chthoniobacterales bacterium]
MQAKRKSPVGSRGRFERWNVVISILIAGCGLPILMLGISYPILTHTLRTKILRDRQTFVQLIAHLVGDDLSRTGAIVDYYQTFQRVREILSSPFAEVEGQSWLNETYYSHPRIDGLFLTTADGRLIAAIPPEPGSIGRDYNSAAWLRGASTAKNVFVSPVHPRAVDQRPAANLIGKVRAADGSTLGYIGSQVLVERIGRRLSMTNLPDGARCQIVDQSGQALFNSDFTPKTGPSSSNGQTLIKDIRTDKAGYIERNGKIHTFAPVESTGWTTVVSQPRAIAYQALNDLLRKIVLLALSMIILAAIFAWSASEVYRRQSEAAARIDREVMFNDKILANMPIGIALIAPTSQRFLQTNEAFAQMARRFGKLPPDREIS